MLLNVYIHSYLEKIAVTQPKDLLVALTPEQFLLVDFNEL